MNNQPPKWPLRFFRWFCNPDFAEDIEGDLLERFEKRSNDGKAARWLFTLDVLKLMRPGIIRQLEGTQKLNYYGMFKIYLTSGWRNFLKHKTHSLINVFGLTMGFAAATLLFLIVRYEQSYDSFHEKQSSIYRVADLMQSGDISDHIVTPQVPMMVEEYPEILHGTRFFGNGSLFDYNGTALSFGYHVVDPDFARIFDFSAISGDLYKTLEAQNEIAITQKMATHLFGDIDPIGKTITMIGENKSFTVTTLLKDPSANSSLQFESLIPWSAAPQWLVEIGDWYNTFNTGYVEIQPTANPKLLEDELDGFVKEHFLDDKKNQRIALLPLADEHSRLSSNKQMIYILGVIATIILTVSCINFMNLTISQTLGRVKEIGIRKVLGSRKGQLTAQFVTESIITSALAVCSGFLLVWIGIPYVNRYFGFGINTDILANLDAFLILGSICLLTALAASLFPSGVLSRLKMIGALRGQLNSHRNGTMLRRSLMIVQFSFSIFILLGSVIIWKQIGFMKDHDLKFDGKNVVGITMHEGMFKNLELAYQKLTVLQDELAKESSILATSTANSTPGALGHLYNQFVSTDQDPKKVNFRLSWIDHNYFKTLNIKIAQGRSFSDQLNENRSVIINEAAMRAYGWTDIENKTLRPANSDKEYQVVGVVEDYYYQSLKELIEPVIHYYEPLNTTLIVKLQPDRINDGLKVLEGKWEELEAYTPFDYYFVDDTFAKLYAEHERTATTTTLFSIIALVIAGMGLLGSISFMVQTRKKEIGIRKVLGASANRIIFVLSKSFTWIILFAILIASGATYYFASGFLEDFAYRITISPWIFILGGASVLAGAILLISLQSYRVATENPVHSLRDE